DPLTAPSVAEIVEVPTPAPVATLPARVAIAGADDAQVTDAVRFCVNASVYVPVATNPRLVPFAIDGLAGVTAIDTSLGGVSITRVTTRTASRSGRGFM